MLPVLKLLAPWAGAFPSLPVTHTNLYVPLPLNVFNAEYSHDAFHGKFPRLVETKITVCCNGNRFYNRKREMESLTTLFRSSPSFLVLHGLPSTGKTRLVNEVVSQREKKSFPRL